MEQSQHLGAANCVEKLNFTLIISLHFSKDLVSEEFFGCRSVLHLYLEATLDHICQLLRVACRNGIIVSQSDLSAESRKIFSQERWP